MNATILLAEDEADLRLVLRNNLQFVGYRVLEASDGPAAQRCILEQRPDLVILDIMMPEKTGLEVLQEVRGKGFVGPVIFLTARAQEADRIAGFEVGADDYVVKPFSVTELLCRVKAILRRSAQAPPTAPYRFGELKIDLEAYRVTRPGRKAALSFFEAEILRVLLEHLGEPVSRNTLLDEVWGDAYPTNRAVDNHILNLRKKVEVNPGEPKHILTVHRVGYRFVAPDNF